MNKKIEKTVKVKNDNLSIDKTDNTELTKNKANKPISRVLPIEKLVEFPDHPYHVEDGIEMGRLVESIRENGVLSPIIVRKTEEGEKYEIISGHRRVHAAGVVRLKKIPAIVYEIDRDEAAIMLVDSNLHREDIKPSEKAFAYKMKLEAMKRKAGRPPKENSSPLETNLRSDEKLARESEDSRAQIQRYIRLTNLIPELLDMMDESKIAFSVGVELSFLDDKLQYDVLNICEENDCTPSYAQAVRMHKLYREGHLDSKSIVSILSQEKANQKEKVSISLEKLKGRIPESYNPRQREEFIIKACEYYANYLLRQREYER